MRSLNPLNPLPGVTLVPTMPMSMVLKLEGTHRYLKCRGYNGPWFPSLLLNQFDIMNWAKRAGLQDNEVSWETIGVREIAQSTYVVIDNGYAEDKYCDDPFELKRCTDLFKAAVVTAPEDSEKPIEAIGRFIQYYRRHGDHDMAYLVTIHEASYAEIKRFMEEVSHMFWGTNENIVWGIPKSLGMARESVTRSVEYIVRTYMRKEHLKIHLLGIHCEDRDLEEIGRGPHKTIDSTWPVYRALNIEKCDRKLHSKETWEKMADWGYKAPYLTTVWDFYNRLQDELTVYEEASKTLT